MKNKDIIAKNLEAIRQLCEKTAIAENQEKRNLAVIEDIVKGQKTTRSISLKYNQFPTQAKVSEAIKNGARVVAFIGGRRSGKTYCGARELLKQIYLYNARPAIGWIVAPTYPMSQIPLREFASVAQPFILKYLKGERAFILRPRQFDKAGFRIEVKTAEYPDRLRGPGLGVIWIDEMITKDAWDILLPTVLDTGGKIIITTTPKGKNWLYEDVYLRSLTDSHFAIVRARTEDNPTLDPVEIARLRNSYSEVFAKQELDAEFVEFEGKVYSFDPVQDVVEPFALPPDAKVYCGIDFGYSDPFVVLWLTKLEDVWFVIDEHYEAHRPLDYHAKIINNSPYRSRVYRYWADPSGAQQRADLMNYGIQVTPAKNDLMEGIMHLENLFSRHKIKICKNCVNTIQELGMYSYPSRDGKNKGEKPIDFANHTCDALRYVIYSEESYKIGAGYGITYEIDQFAEEPKIINTSKFFSEMPKDWVNADKAIMPDRKAMLKEYLRILEEE